jgi:hypothetical protein
MTMTLEVKDWEALSAAQYGQLAASKVHYGVHFPEAMRRLRLSLPAFERSEERWVEKLRRAAIEGDRSTLEEFATAYAAERARLAEDAPRLAPEPQQSTLDPDVTHPPFQRNVAVLPFREAARALLESTRVPPMSSGVTAPDLATAEASPRDELDGTLMIRSPLASVSQSGFGASLTPTLVPDLSLDAYAMLQADLRVSPNSAEPLRRAGVPSEGALEALRQRFFQRFQADPQAQAEFQARFRVHLARLGGR